MADNERRHSEGKHRRSESPVQQEGGSVVKKGGVARSDAEVADVGRDTYGTPLGPGASEGPVGETERRSEDRTTDHDAGATSPRDEVNTE